MIRQKASTGSINDFVKQWSKCVGRPGSVGSQQTQYSNDGGGGKGGGCVGGMEGKGWDQTCWRRASTRCMTAMGRLWASLSSLLSSTSAMQPGSKSGGTCKHGTAFQDSCGICESKSVK